MLVSLLKLFFLHKVSNFAIYTLLEIAVNELALYTDSLFE